MKFLINKLNNFKEATLVFWSENKSAILAGIIVTVVGGYILFVITTDSPSENISQINEPTYFDSGVVPATHSVDATEEYRNIRELNAGSPITKFEDVLGEYTFVNQLSDEVIEYIFVNPLYYVEAAVNLNKIVIYYSVTTRKSGFNPKFEFGPWYADVEKPLVVELGKTLYSELDTMFRGNPVYATYSAGVNQFYYFESYYAGRPGNYQSFIFSTNQAGAAPSWPPLDPSYNTVDNIDLYSDTAIDDENWIKYRKEATINTYTETVPYYGVEDIINDLAKQHFGPNLQQARLAD
ncbi:hypothetical protein KC926_00650 [Candidatus Kaiserbacteria bacterium]|nr:hypothetical protein [Candidatus Kaiserbacteria bacterium]